MRPAGFCISAAGLLLCALLAAQTPRAKVLEQRRKQYPDLSRLVELVQSVPPEFSADVLLRVATCARLHDTVWKRELLEQVFESAHQVQQPVRLRVINQGMIDFALSRTDMMSLGFDQRLDQLSLESAAVQDMLEVDKRKALEMFQTVILPACEPRTCKDALVYDVSDYYSALAQVADSSFSPKERGRGLHVELLNYAIGGMRAQAEVPAMANVLSSARLAPEELRLLAGSFAAALDRIPPDDRSFSSAVEATDRELRKLVETLRGNGISADELIAAYRQYLVRNFTGNRCAHKSEKDSALPVIESFNKNLASVTNANLAPLAADQIKPTRVEGEAKLDPFFDDAELGRGWEQYLHLALGKEQEDVFAEPLSDEQKDTAEWRTQFDDFLRQVDELKPAAGEPEYRYFYRKATALEVLLRTAPPGTARDKVVQQFIAFLAGATFQQESPLEWFAQLYRTASAVKELSESEYQKLLAEMQRSGNPVLALYAIAERTVPRNQ